MRLEQAPARPAASRQPSKSKQDLNMSLTELSLMEAAKENNAAPRKAAPLVKTLSTSSRHARSGSM